MAHQERVQKNFCTTRDAARLLGVSLRTAQLWVESGLLEAWKTSGGHRRISRSSIERLLDKPIRDESFPENERSDPATPLQQTGAVADKALSILVIEDESALRLVYEMTLKRWPMSPVVHTAGDGYEALVRLGSIEPDMLITDLNMPGMDGFQMIRTLRNLPELAGMRIVVVSGLDSEEIRARGDLPADIPVFPKPIPFDQLRQIAEEVLAERHRAPLSQGDDI